MFLSHHFLEVNFWKGIARAKRRVCKLLTALQEGPDSVHAKPQGTSRPVCPTLASLAASLHPDPGSPRPGLLALPSFQSAQCLEWLISSEQLAVLPPLSDLPDAKSRALDNIGRVFARVGKFQQAIDT